MSGAAETIDLTRNTPPTPSLIDDRLRDSLARIGGTDRASLLLRYHRYAGTDLDREVGSSWLSPRVGAGCAARLRTAR
jgi:hypothetical protein